MIKALNAFVMNSSDFCVAINPAGAAKNTPDRKRLHVFWLRMEHVSVDRRGAGLPFGPAEYDRVRDKFLRRQDSNLIALHPGLSLNAGL